MIRAYGISFPVRIDLTTGRAPLLAQPVGLGLPLSGAALAAMVGVAMQSVEFGTSQAERLRPQLQGRPMGARAAQRTQASPGAALLYGVMLHAAPRLKAGLELTAAGSGRAGLRPWRS